MNEGTGEGTGDRQQEWAWRVNPRAAIGGPFYFSGERVSAKSPGMCWPKLCKSLLRGARGNYAAAKEHEDAITRTCCGDHGAAGVGGRRYWCARDVRAENESARRTGSAEGRGAGGADAKTCD